MRPPRWDRAALAVVVGLCAVKASVHLALVGRYGYHGDELYFVECGRHLAFGYVDHPPLIPWIARVADDLGGGLLLLRLPAIVAGTGTLALTALIVREWGGGVWAQLVALLALLVAPANLRMAAMLDIPVVEVFLCTCAAYFVVRARARGESWPWLAAGVALGLGVMAKHSSGLWGAALALGLVAVDRRAFASPWPWVGAGIAGVLVLPNLGWQVQHDNATLEFLHTLRGEVLAEQGRLLFVAGQLLYFHPLAAPVWLAGLGWAFTARGEPARPFALLFLVMFIVLLGACGKPYYLASAYPPVLAAGAIALERALVGRPVMYRAFTGSLCATGLALGLVTLPVLPLPTVDRAVGALLGWAVPPIGLTHDLHGMYGWEEHAATVGRVYEALPSADQEKVSILTQSYAQASAVNVLRDTTLPRAVSGHLSYYLWGPDGDRGEVLIAYGVALDWLRSHYRTCEEAARIDAPMARPGDHDLAVYVCRGPTGRMVEWWPEVKRYGHLSTGARATAPGLGAIAPALVFFAGLAYVAADRGWIARALNRQAASPTGLVGRLLGLVWRREHARLNAEVLDRLEIRRGDRVLEIGSGPGHALREAARRATAGRVLGIDASEVMVRQARHHNRHTPQVEVRLGDADALALEGQSFDRIFSVHCLYFWEDIPATVAHLAAALHPDGRLLLAFRPEGDDIPARFRDPIYHFPQSDRVEAALRELGLREVRSERSTAAPEVVLVMATR
ncbi:MAG: glycosyltransferase family 39 protein [Myxococcota bacterium]